MNEQKSKHWLQLLQPVGVYTLFALQFAIPAKYTIDWVDNILTAHKMSIKGWDSTDKALLLVVLFSIPFVTGAWFFQRIFRDLRDRVTLKSRLDNFEAAVAKIGRYHEKHPVSDIIEQLRRDPAANADAAARVVLLMIDFLIIDLREAFQELCQCADIRVSLYMESEQEVVYEHPPELVLHMVATTEFDKEYEIVTKFRRVGDYKRYEGFCGAAWDSGTVISGTHRKFGFIRDPRFSLGNDQVKNSADREKSFLCLPITTKPVIRAPVIAVISVDSTRRYDLLLSNETSGLIYLKTTRLRTILRSYVLMLAKQLDRLESF